MRCYFQHGQTGDGRLALGASLAYKQDGRSAEIKWLLGRGTRLSAIIGSMAVATARITHGGTDARSFLLLFLSGGGVGKSKKN